MERNLVYLQVYATCGSGLKKTRRWRNLVGFATVEEAYAALEDQKAERPDLDYRVLDNNKVTHTR